MIKLVKIDTIILDLDAVDIIYIGIIDVEGNYSIVIEYKSKTKTINNTKGFFSNSYSKTNQSYSIIGETEFLLKSDAKNEIEKIFNNLNIILNDGKTKKRKNEKRIRAY